MYSAPSSFRNPSLSPTRGQLTLACPLLVGATAPFPGHPALSSSWMALYEAQLPPPGASLIALDPSRRPCLFVLSAAQRPCEGGSAPEPSLLPASWPQVLHTIHTGGGFHWSSGRTGEVDVCIKPAVFNQRPRLSVFHPSRSLGSLRLAQGSKTSSVGSLVGGVCVCV